MKNQKPKVSTKSNIPIIVALIGFFATILAALISVYGNRDSITPTLVAVTVTKPTFTVQPGQPTSTPFPLTDTPIPPIAIGQDWMAGCISRLWKVYPSNISTVERGDGCWREPVYSFSAENGDLDFLSERGSGAAEIYGLFAPLPENGTVKFTVRLRDLDNVDLWMGIFAEPDVTSQGLLMIIPSGNVNKRVIVQKDPISYDTLQGTILLNQGNGFSISFTFTPLSARSMVNSNAFVTNSISIPSPQKWLFLGYKGLSGSYRIDGTFLQFELKP